jgi:hypothetical protein
MTAPLPSFSCIFPLLASLSRVLAPSISALGFLVLKNQAIRRTGGDGAMHVAQKRPLQCVKVPHDHTQLPSADMNQTNIYQDGGTDMHAAASEMLTV